MRNDRVSTCLFQIFPLELQIGFCHTLHMDTEKAFAAIERRAHRVRKTMPEVAACAKISRQTLWRAMGGHHKTATATLVVIRKMEDVVSAIEKERAL